MAMFGDEGGGAPELHGYSDGLGQAERVGVFKFRVYDAYGNVVPEGTKYFFQVGAFYDRDAKFVQTDANGFISVEYFHPTADAPFPLAVTIDPAFPAAIRHYTVPKRLTWAYSGAAAREFPSLRFHGKKVQFEKPGAAGYLPIWHTKKNQGLPESANTGIVKMTTKTETPAGTSGLSYFYR
jgi:hypothetical protein